MSASTVSILIPTLNGEADLSELLPALAAQRSDARIDLVAVDSSSRDGTVDALQAAGFRVETIERSEFGHGRTRNRLARQARGEFLIFLSQDAVPTDPGFVEAMLRPFEDPSIAGVTARVLPFPGDDPLTARTVLAAREASPRSSTRRWSDPENYGALTGAERVELLRFNNVASCIRHDVLDAFPFPDVPFGEDFAWAARVLAAGWALHESGEATVRHAHRYGPRAAFERYRVDAIFHREYFGHAVRPSLFSVAKGIAYEVRQDLAYLAGGGRVAAAERPVAGPARRLGAALRSPWLRTAQVLGQYVGSRGDGEAWDEARRRGAMDFVPIGRAAAGGRH